MKTPDIRKGIKSNFAAIEQSLLITEKPEKKWSNQRRNTKLVSVSVRQSRADYELQLTRLQVSSYLRIAPREEKIVYLVTKCFVFSPGNVIYSPIGFKNTFENKTDLFIFAREQGRKIVKIGKKEYVVIDELNKIQKQIEDEIYKIEIDKQVSAIRNRLYSRDGD